MKTQSKKITAFAAILAGTGLAAVEFTGSAEGARTVLGATADIPAQRIGAAFDLVAAMPASEPMVMGAAPKGDREPVRCAGETWPAVSAGCLVRADGAPARASRTVTVEYPASGAKTVLVRMPVAVVASR